MPFRRDPLDLNFLDTVVKKTISAVESSKHQIFEIAESTRRETQNIELELERIRTEVTNVIQQTDRLEIEYRQSRQRLVEVSQNFQKYSETDIQKAYEEAFQIQAELSVSRDKETNLRNRRDELDRRLRNLNDTIEKADCLMTQITVVLGYLTGDLGGLSSAIESAQLRQQMGLQIIQAQEEERRRVARDIHDGPAQSMAHLVTRTEILEKLISQGRIEEVKDDLKDLKETVRGTLADVRKIIFDLRPMALDDLGLLPTLRKYIEDFCRRFPLKAEFTTLGRERRLPSAMEVAVFRIIQEALNNVVKHAGATLVNIKIELLDKEVVVLVEDNGGGFEATEQDCKKQFGLLGMKERMKLLNGSLKVISKTGAGTKVFFKMPIESREESTIQ